MDLSQKPPAELADQLAQLAEIAGRIDLASLAPAQLQDVFKAAAFQRVVRQADRLINLAGQDLDALRGKFLQSARSEHTREAYRRALDRLVAWGDAQGLQRIDLLDLDPAQADDWILWLRTNQDRPLAPASVRLMVAAASAFYTWLERRVPIIRSPFRGTKARPPRQAARETIVPTRTELDQILAALPPVTRAAAAVMAFRGLRVGALPSLRIRPNGTWTARTKGADQLGTLPPQALEAIREAGLDPRAPFQGLTAAQLADRFRAITGRLAAQGTIAAAFSAHDLRHFFAVQTYQADRDLHRLKGLLGHASVQVTETYLKTLGVQA